MITKLGQAKRATAKSAVDAVSCQKADGKPAFYVKNCQPDVGAMTKDDAKERFAVLVRRFALPEGNWNTGANAYIDIRHELEARDLGAYAYGESLMYLEAVLLTWADDVSFVNAGDCADILEWIRFRGRPTDYNLPTTKRQIQILYRDAQFRRAARLYATTKRPHQLAMLFGAAIDLCAFGRWNHGIAYVAGHVIDAGCPLPASLRQLNRIFTPGAMWNIPFFSQMAKQIGRVDHA